MNNQNNEEYWQERAEQLIAAAEEIYADYAVELDDQYKSSVSLLTAQINDFYAAYDLSDPMSIYKSIDSDEIKQLRIETAEVYKASSNKAFKAYCKKMGSLKRVQRIESLLFKTSAEIEKLHTAQEAGMTRDMKLIYTSSRYRELYNLQQGLQLGAKVEIVTNAIAEKAIKQQWLEKNYPERIWDNGKKLVETLRQQIPQGIVMGNNPRVVGKQIEKAMKTSQNRAETLARTEYLHITNEASFDAMEESGVVDKYKYHATLDYKTSDICRDMDGKIFELTQKKLGINFPPLHPRCRSTTIPYFDGDSIGTRIARDISGKSYYVQGDMTYKEWAQKHGVDAQMPASEKERRIRLRYKKRWNKMSENEQKEAMRRFDEKMIS